MLAKDKELFLEFTSGDPGKVSVALRALDARPAGHFEDHPLARSLVESRLQALIDLWTGDTTPSGAKKWVAQFIADARVGDPAVRAIVEGALSDRSCNYIPTLLFLMGCNANNFMGSGRYLLPLATHPSRDVRWRVAWVISKMKMRDSQMLEALRILAGDSDPATQTYVRECRH
jgi:hypothetical protein